MRLFRLSIAAAGGLVLILTVPVSLSAQQDGCRPTWIFFTGKDAPAEVAPETAEHALQRRRLRGSERAKTLAAPVSPEYVKALEDEGIPIRTVSKWLNAASVCLNVDKAPRIATLPFIKETRPVGLLRASTDRHLPERDTPRLPSLLKAQKVVSSDTVYGASRTQLEVINAIAPLEMGYNGEGVRIGFLDTAYDFSQPAFERMISEGRLIETRSFIHDNMDTNLHGLYVSSTATGYDPGYLIGPCWNGEVLAATTEVTEFERNIEEDYFVAGMEWLEEMGADVVNVSLGYDRFNDGERSYTLDDLNGDTMVTSRAADAAVALGVTVVAAAGNAGGCGAHSETCWYHIGSPAEADSVIAAGGVQSDSLRTRWPSSSVGPTIDERTKPDVMALSVSVYYANSRGGYGNGNGTSFAAPLVSGVICQILQANPHLAPRQVWQVLTETAGQAESPDNFMGWGVVDAAAAVDKALSLLAGDRPAVPETASVGAPYPNPASTYFTIDISGPSARHATVLYVTDVTGRIIIRRPLDRSTFSQRIDISGLPAGVYVVSVRSDETVESHKLVVYR